MLPCKGLRQSNPLWVFPVTRYWPGLKLLHKMLPPTSHFNEKKAVKLGTAVKRTVAFRNSNLFKAIRIFWQLLLTVSIKAFFIHIRF